jgi:phenylalanine-4-hydroxylase
VPDDIFFAMLSARVFPVGNFIRRREELDYLEEPDCFHDLFGHIPMLAHHDFAEMVEHVGRLGTAAIAAGEGDASREFIGTASSSGWRARRARSRSSERA